MPAVSCNIHRENFKKIQSPFSSCNIWRSEIKKIQKLVFSVGENALYCNGGVGACIFPAKKSSILQLENSVCIFLAQKHAILKLAERTCIFFPESTAILQMALGRRKTSGSALYFFFEKSHYIETRPGYMAPHCIFSCRNHTILQPHTLSKEKRLFFLEIKL